MHWLTMEKRSAKRSKVHCVLKTCPEKPTGHMVKKTTSKGATTTTKKAATAFTEEISSVCEVVKEWC